MIRLVLEVFNGERLAAIDATAKTVGAKYKKTPQTKLTVSQKTTNLLPQFSVSFLFVCFVLKEHIFRVMLVSQTGQKGRALVIPE